MKNQIRLFIAALTLFLGATGFCDTFTLKDEATGRTYGPFEIKEGQEVAIDKQRLKISAVHSGAFTNAAYALEAALKATVIPQAVFRNASAADCIAFVQHEVHSQKPDVACNIVVREISGIPSSAKAPVNVTMQKINAHVLLQEICEQVGYTMEITDTAVILSPKKKTGN